MIQRESMRRSFAAVLIILVLAMTSWASACDLSCSLRRFHSNCNLQGWADRAGAVPSLVTAMDPKMDMANDASPAAHPQAGLAHLHDNSCTHNACNETSVSAISKRAPEHRHHAMELVGFDRPTAATIRKESRWPAAEQESPNLQPFDPLSVNLRI